MSGPIHEFTLGVWLFDPDVAKVRYVPIPTKCKLVDIHSVVDGVVGGSNEALTFLTKKPAGIGVALGGLTLTLLTAGSAAGDTASVVNDQTDAEAIENHLEEGDSIAVFSLGSSTGSYNALITFVFERA